LLETVVTTLKRKKIITTEAAIAVSKSPADKTRERAAAALVRNQRQQHESRIAQANAKQRESELRGEWKKQCDVFLGAAKNGLNEAKFRKAVIYPGRLLSIGFQILELKSEKSFNITSHIRNEFDSALDAASSKRRRQEVIISANAFYVAAKASLCRDFYAFQRFSEEFPKNLDWLVKSNVNMLQFLTSDYFGREFHKVYNGPFRAHIDELKRTYESYRNSLHQGVQSSKHGLPKEKSAEKSVITYILSTRAHWPDVSRQSYSDDEEDDSSIGALGESLAQEYFLINEHDEELFPHQAEGELVVRWADHATCTEHLSQPLMSPEGLNWMASNFRRQLVITVIHTLNHHADQGRFPSELELSFLSDIWFVRDHLGIMRPSCLPDDLVYLLKSQGYSVTSSGRSKRSRTLTVK
jgi:hypothetical protein